jgi:hypothetical protein
MASRGTDASDVMVIGAACGDPAAVADAVIDLARAALDGVLKPA